MMNYYEAFLVFHRRVPLTAHLNHLSLCNCLELGSKSTRADAFE